MTWHSEGPGPPPGMPAKGVLVFEYEAAEGAEAWDHRVSCSMCTLAGWPDEDPASDPSGGGAATLFDVEDVIVTGAVGGGAAEYHGGTPTASFAPRSQRSHSPWSRPLSSFTMTSTPPGRACSRAAS